jgi:hypothetical protein
MSERLERFLERLESAAGKIERDLPLGVEEEEALRGLREAAGPTAVSGDIDSDARPPSRKVLKILFPLTTAAAAAALLLFSVFGFPWSSGGPIALGARHIPDEDPLMRGTEVSKREDTFQIYSNKPCHLLVILRTWSRDRDALVWNIYRGKDGISVAAVDFDRPLQFALDVTGDPPVRQFLVLAAASNAADLPRSKEETDRLMERLEGMEAPASESSSAVAAVVAACLPKGVTVEGQEFLVGDMQPRGQ